MSSGINFSDAQISTPATGEEWRTLDLSRQKRLCQELLDQNHCELDVLSTNARGEIVVQFRKIARAAERGAALLDAEEILKKYHPALTIYLQAKDDKNALRKLRGIVINDDRS